MLNLTPNPTAPRPRSSAIAHLPLLCLLTALSSLTAAEGPDILIADFEGKTYGDWKTTGQAFGTGPAAGALPGQMVVDGFLGHGLVNSFGGGDVSVGTLTSPPFPLQRHYLRFLVGGGKQPGKTCLNLQVDGQTVRSATGPNDRPGGTEHLDWAEWDVSDLAGRSAVIEIVDQATGGWGHINVDNILQTDQRLPGTLTNATRPWLVQHRYLHLPVKNGAPKRQMTVLSAGQVARSFEIPLADGPPDWWAFVDVNPFQGQTLTLQVNRIKEDSAGLRNITGSDSIRDAENLYAEPLRPQFHFSARRGWNNDPNGLVQYRGEYHLFFQHNPYGWDWGNMHWGHAVSRDLVHWQELDEALYPDALGTMFSGSAVVDTENTTGWARKGEKAIVCMYTAAGDTSPESKGKKFTQGLAYSTDRGRSWTKYEKNPVLPHIAGGNRDPKVIWYAPEKKWVMALYLDGSDFALFASKDLKQWERLSNVALPGSSECPEFFELEVAHKSKETRWVFYGGNGRYLVGRFDGTRFTPETGPHALNFGNCFYASQTYNQLAGNRRVLIGWGQINFPGMPFNQMMDFPIDLTLRDTSEGLRLFANPVREIESLHQTPHRLRRGPWAAGVNPLAGISGELFDLDLEIRLQETKEIRLEIRGVAVVYDAEHHELACLGKKARLEPDQGKIRLRLLVDRGSIEIFGNEGRLYMPMGVILPQDKTTLSLSSQGGQPQLESGRVYTLKSAWTRAKP